MLRWQLVFTILLIFPVLFFSIVSILIKEHNVPSIRLRGSEDVPQLTLHKGHRYHLFNSRKRRTQPRRRAAPLF